MDTKPSLGKNISDFSLKIYQKLSIEQSNLVFSPASIYLALSMAAIGSDKLTLEQFKQLLNFNTPQELAQDTQALKQILTKQRKGVTTQIANKIYADLPQLGKEYEQLMVNNFDSVIERVSFSSKSEQIRQDINEWVEIQTNQKIKDLLPLGSINNQMKLVLVNAIYFKGEWQNQFEVQKTHKRYFHIEEDQKGQPIQVDAMHKQDKYDFYDNGKYKYVSIPYKGDAFLMEIILPSGPLAKFESTFNSQTFIQARDKKKNTKILLYIPKFKIDPVKSTSLKQTLIQLGIDKVFSGDANFSFMDPSNSIQVSDVIHKAMIEVNEEGAEAAAATAITMELKGSLLKNTTPIMDCNKPFIYSITHKLTKTIMFLGKVTNPLQI